MRNKLFPKGIRLSFSSKKKMKGKARTGSLYLIAVLALITAAGVVAVGGPTPDIKQDSYDPQGVNPYTCCDSGDGAACRPLADQTITYQGKSYGLLKSNVVVYSNNLYGTNEFAGNGERILINTSDSTVSSTLKGCEPGKDLIKMATEKFPRACLGIPNDQIIYLCTGKTDCDQNSPKGRSVDVYFRLGDGLVPSPLAFLCPKPSIPGGTPKQEFKNVPPPAGRKQLQLETFQLQDLYGPFEWLSPWP